MIPIFEALVELAFKLRMHHHVHLLAASTVLFAAGSEIVTLYVRHEQLSDLYAGASAVVVAVVWVYYSAQVFFLGACVGAALRERRAREDVR